MGMNNFSFRLSHKILSIGLIGILGLVVFGAIYIVGSAS
jgi:methyl-accepting chemotaxis protein